MNASTRWLVLFFTVGVLGCGSSSSSAPDPNGPVQGSVNGVSFSATAAFGKKYATAEGVGERFTISSHAGTCDAPDDEADGEQTVDVVVPRPVTVGTTSAVEAHAQYNRRSGDGGPAAWPADKGSVEVVSVSDDGKMAKLRLDGLHVSAETFHSAENGGDGALAGTIDAEICDP